MTFRLTLIVTTVAVLQVGGVDSVFAQGTLYDDFSSPFIRGDRWRTDQPEIGPGSGLETLRLVSEGALLLAHRVVGGPDDVDAHISAARLYFNRNPGGGLKFDVTMLSVTATGCSVAGSNPTDAEARGVIELFQNGSSLATATIGLVRLSTGTDIRALGWVTGLGSVVDLGLVPIGTKVTLRISWDPVNNRINFQRNAEPVQTVMYDVDDSIPISPPFVLFEAVGFVPNCTDSRRLTAVISALFDNVYINP